jgi:uncharacterized 2Fe-2S/4Fe-4S cluster protein (DUF4445 family)
VGGEIIADAPAGENLLRVIRAAGLNISADCGGQKKCGKCKVLIDGVPALACETEIHRDMTVTIPSAEESEKYDILTDSGERGRVTHCAEECALAIDIGTTTIVAKLIGLSSGADIITAAEMNEQRTYGADVISRINVSMDDASGLCAVVTKQINRMIREMLEGSETAPDAVRRLVISGNTTMCYTLLNLPCRSLGLAPFEPEYGIEQEYSYDEVFHADTLKCPVYIMPFISAYIGGDITAGLLTRRGADTGEPFILVDMGTNGEIAFYSDGRLLCTAAAAGPAFEGGNISCGSGSVEGAISKVRVRGGGFEYDTIGGAPARSICGSGILDAMACFVSEGIIDASGALNEDSPFAEEGRILIAPPAADGPAYSDGSCSGGIALTQKDIREFQLAKSAIRTGIEILIIETGGNAPDKLFLAGGFGQNLDPDSAVKVGLLPDSLKGKVIPIGNSSLNGASMAAKDTALLSTAQSIAKDGREINLAAHHSFNELFMEHMMF